MRACGVCFFFRVNPDDRAEGSCMNRPPLPVPVSQPDGSLEVLNIRPTVETDDYCSFFGHRKEPKLAGEPRT